ncbi:Shwachman-Bodian-diamond syndrome protein [Basidiobolus meristosporus CBS 931.73]|uniref:Ribosome maturation protein SDO1 n=1 Tax=Basidiobolus meristosporus CBS 931.73 TaxID=1314790 RepID=A0A1Y1YLU2_9FUNG|nr:Shwachman-Bodian-diamond syndrome protein [Basidiobolus meristosporus CBS 931.73]|eukprot:ORX98965.1 Shwachman-Bodian-diamond syndrome protein [Basidiobolus meristosporus CBS 931.73]
MSIFQPSNQIKLTNVSVVRLKKGGKRFEVACYKNKIIEWRKNIETDIDEVLQIHSIFTNVSKGHIASKDELKKAFKTDDEEKIIHEILKKGQEQVSEKERAHQLDNMYRDIATIVTEKCINPETKRPYTVTLIEKAMGELHFSVHPNKNSKQQALDVIRQLQEKNIIPIARAQMRVRITLPGKDGKHVKEKLMAFVSSVEDEDWGDEYELICRIDPGHYRGISETLQTETKGRGQLEMLNLRETEEGDGRFA